MIKLFKRLVIWVASVIRPVKAVKILIGSLYVKSSVMMALANYNMVAYLRLVMRDARARGQLGAVNVETIIMIFIGIVILYQLIPQIGSDNATVQASANASTMAKFAAGLGEWMFPLLGIIALVFVLFRKRKDGDSQGV